MPLAAIIVIGVVVLLALAAGLAYALGFGPDVRPLRASAAEASERTQDLAAEFFEWLRTGR